MTPTPEQLRELKELEAKATKAPWRRYENEYGQGVLGDETGATFSSVFFQFKDVVFEQTDDDEALIIAMRNALPALIAAAERCAEFEKRTADVIADYLDGRREVDKALNEFGYDDIRFADVRHGWLFSTRRAKEWPEVKAAFETYNKHVCEKEQDLAKAALGGRVGGA